MVTSCTEDVLKNSDSNAVWAIGRKEEGSQSDSQTLKTEWLFIGARDSPRGKGMKVSVRQIREESTGR